jgi:hypothetical protein
MQSHGVAKFSINSYLFETNDRKTWAGSFKGIPLHFMSLLSDFCCDVFSLTATYSHFPKQIYTLHHTWIFEENSANTLTDLLTVFSSWVII